MEDEAGEDKGMKRREGVEQRIQGLTEPDQVPEHCVCTLLRPLDILSPPRGHTGFLALPDKGLLTHLAACQPSLEKSLPEVSA